MQILRNELAHCIAATCIPLQGLDYYILPFLLVSSAAVWQLVCSLVVALDLDIPRHTNIPAHSLGNVYSMQNVEPGAGDTGLWRV